MAARGEFSSRMAFVLAASGSAIGLGNIWGFPSNVAENGGGAFVFTYMVLTFLLAYPILMAELVIGRHAKADTIESLSKISGKFARPMAYFTGYWGILTASLILSFYAIVAGWMVAFGLGSVADLLSLTEVKDWLTTQSVARNLTFVVIFYLLTIGIVANGVVSGIEKWSTRLMPLLILLILGLIIYISTLEGAAEGWKVYLQPDFDRIFDANLVISALGQAFFSLSLGVGTMMIYGSYVSKSENLPKLGATVAALDIGIAVMAGMLVIPAMYVAQANGVTIFSADNTLIDSDGLIFNVLPSLFAAMGAGGAIVSILFFTLMTIAAVTSSISMLEVPVARVQEAYQVERRKAAWITGLVILSISCVIVFNFSALFGWVIRFTTEISEPLIGILFCIFAGWVWRRNDLLEELKQGNPNMQETLFWKIWPAYVKVVCPIIVAAVFIHSSEYFSGLFGTYIAQPLQVVLYSVLGQ